MLHVGVRDWVAPARFRQCTVQAIRAPVSMGPHGLIDSRDRSDRVLWLGTALRTKRQRPDHSRATCGGPGATPRRTAHELGLAYSTTEMAMPAAPAARGPRPLAGRRDESRGTV